MSSANSLGVFLVFLAVLYDSAFSSPVNQICVVCDGDNCEDRVCPLEKNSCATISNKDDVVVTRGCVEETACDKLNQQTDLMRRVLSMASSQDKEVMQNILAEVLVEMRKRYEDKGISFDLEELSLWKCEGCSSKRCNG